MAPIWTSHKMFRHCGAFFLNTSSSAGNLHARNVTNRENHFHFSRTFLTIGIEWQTLGITENGSFCAFRTELKFICLIFCYVLNMSLYLSCISIQWCESDSRCNRLQITDLLVAPLQHLTKYPLLLKVFSVKYTQTKRPN